MEKQVLSVLSGGRPKGNTAQLVEAFTRGAEPCCKFSLVDYIGFHDRGMLLAGGCGDTNGPPRIGTTDCLERAFAFEQTLYSPEELF